MLVDIESAGEVRVLWMRNGPDNFFNQDFLDDFNKGLDQIEQDPAARAMVFSGGHTKFFSNGIDIPWALRQDFTAAEKFLLTYVGLVHRLFLFPKPVIAAINGHAIAGGFFLAMCADWRVMREDQGWLCIPEIDLPFDLPLGHIALTAYVTGTRNTDYLSLSGDRITAKDALRYNAIDEAVQPDQVIPRALEKARFFAAKDPLQFSRHKKHLRALAAKVILEQDPPFMSELARKVKDLES